jgi:hypothetical protein
VDILFSVELIERAGNAPACANNFGDENDNITNTNHTALVLSVNLLLVDFVTGDHLKNCKLKGNYTKNPR